MSKLKKTSVDEGIYNFSSKQKIGSLKGIGSKRNSASHIMNNTF